MSERFIVLCGTQIEPWVYTDEPFKMTREKTVDLLASGEALSMCKVVGFDLDKGTCRDATKEIATEVVNIWAHDGEPLSFSKREFVELQIGIRAANQFRMEDAR